MLHVLSSYHCDSNHSRIHELQDETSTRYSPTETGKVTPLSYLQCLQSTAERLNFTDAVVLFYVLHFPWTSWTMQQVTLYSSQFSFCGCWNSAYQQSKHKSQWGGSTYSYEQIWTKFGVIGFFVVYICSMKHMCLESIPLLHETKRSKHHLLLKHKQLLNFALTDYEYHALNSIWFKPLAMHWRKPVSSKVRTG